MRKTDKVFAEGKLIYVEGPDYVGKTHFINLFAAKLKSEGYAVTVIRQPGGTPFGESLRDMHLAGTNKDALSTSAMMIASRIAALKEITTTILDNEKAVVLIDRWDLSNRAHQYCRAIIDGVSDVEFMILAQVLTNAHHVTSLDMLNPITLLLNASEETLQARHEASPRKNESTKSDIRLVEMVREYYSDVLFKPNEYHFKGKFIQTSHGILGKNVLAFNTDTYKENAAREQAYSSNWGDNTQWLRKQLSSMTKQ
jgi:thymidylate kinase